MLIISWTRFKFLGWFDKIKVTVSLITVMGCSNKKLMQTSKEVIVPAVGFCLGEHWLFFHAVVYSVARWMACSLARSRNIYVSEYLTPNRDQAKNQSEVFEKKICCKAGQGDRPNPSFDIFECHLLTWLKYQKFSVPQIEYPLGGSTKKGSHVYFLLIIAMVLLLWGQIVLLWHQKNIYIRQ